MKLSQVLCFVILICLTQVVAGATYQYTTDGQAAWNGTCNSNPTRQSPIDIPCQDFLNICPSLPTYQQYWNNPTSFFGNSTKEDLTTSFYGQNSWVLFTNASSSYLFKSAQFHLHQPSQHTINGVSYPLQLHIVHVLANSDITQYLVVGLLFQVNTTLTYDIFDYAPIGSASNFSHLFPIPVTNKPAYHYLGSLTTPPCAEKVNWFLQTETIKLTNKTMTDLISKVGGGKKNARFVQPLNGRTVYLVGQGC